MNGKRLLTVLVAVLVAVTCLYFARGFLVSLGLDLETMFYTLLNGAFLIIGVYLGEKLTLDGVEKRVRKFVSGSRRVQQLFVVLDRVSEMLNSPETERDLDRLLTSAAEFFESGKELLSSPEAKNFFVNATELLRQFTKEEKSDLRIPEKPKAKEP